MLKIIKIYPKIDGNYKFLFLLFKRYFKHVKGGLEVHPFYAQYPWANAYFAPIVMAEPAKILQSPSYQITILSVLKVFQTYSNSFPFIVAQPVDFTINVSLFRYLFCKHHSLILFPVETVHELLNSSTCHCHQSQEMNILVLARYAGVFVAVHLTR